MNSRRHTHFGPGTLAALVGVPLYLTNISALPIVNGLLTQGMQPGAAIALPGWNGGPYNLKTMVGNYVLADEQGVPTSMGKYYDLPVFGLGGSTDAKVLDHQALALVLQAVGRLRLVHPLDEQDVPARVRRAREADRGHSGKARGCFGMRGSQDDDQKEEV